MTEPRDIAVLVYFRIAFGLITVWEMWRFVDPAHDWVDGSYTDKAFYFAYWPFTFVEPLPEPWIHSVFWITGFAGLMVALGLFYRLAATIQFAGLAYIFLLDQAQYLNHFYLIVLLSFLLIWLPAHRAFSLDARHVPGMRSDTAPAWCLWLLRFQVAVPYVFGGIAKLNSDWLRGEPLRDWLSVRTDFPLIGRFFENEAVVLFMNYSALLLDLFVVFALLYKRTRAWAFLTVVSFHILNSRLFGIGVFPWLMMPATLVFFDPSWPRQFVADLRAPKRPLSPRVVGFGLGAIAGTLAGAYVPFTVSPWKAAIAAFSIGILGWEFGDLARGRGAEVTMDTDAAEEPDESDDSRESFAPATLGWGATALLASWVVVQVLVPLRHLVIPSNVHWSEEGHNFSWHMKLRDKSAAARIFATADGEVYEVDPDDLLTNRQERKMSTRPHMLVEFARAVEADFHERGFTDVEVRAEVWASLNGRDNQLLVDPAVDLAKLNQIWFGGADWIMPLKEPLKSDNR